MQGAAGGPTDVLSTGPRFKMYVQLRRANRVSSDSFRAQLPDAGSVYSAFSPSEPLLLLAGSGAPEILNVRTGGVTKTLIGPKVSQFSFVSNEVANSEHDLDTGWIAPDEAVMQLSDDGTPAGIVVLNAATKRWSGALLWKPAKGNYGDTQAFCPLPDGRVLAVNWTGLKLWGYDTLTLISDYGKAFAPINAAALGTTFNVSCPNTESGYIYLAGGPKPASGDDAAPAGGWLTSLFSIQDATIDGTSWVRYAPPGA